MNHIVALSGGKDSTAMALELRRRHPERDFIYFSTPTGNEFEEVFHHLRDLETRLGQQIHLLGWDGGDRLQELVSQQAMIPNFRARFCTRMLKIEPAIAFLKAHAPCYQYVALRADEPTRKGLYGEYDGIEQVFPLQDWGWGLDEVVGFLGRQGVQVPMRTDCKFCFFQRLGEWKHLWRAYPEDYQAASDIETTTGYTWRSPQRDQWPAPLAELALEFERGRPLRGEKLTQPPAQKLTQNPAQLNLFDNNCEQDALCRVWSL